MAYIFWSLHDLYSVLNLTQCSGVPSNWSYQLGWSGQLSAVADKRVDCHYCFRRHCSKQTDGQVVHRPRRFDTDGHGGVGGRGGQRHFDCGHCFRRRRSCTKQADGDGGDR